MAQQTTGTTGPTTTSTTDQSATTSGSTNLITFTLRMEDQGAGGEPEGGTATSSDLSTRKIGVEVNLIRGNEAPISLPINVTIPANVNNLELCASAIEAGMPAAEMCQPVLRTIDLTQNTTAATTTDDTTASGTTTSSSPFSSSPSSSSAPTMTAPTTSFPPTATGGNSLIGGGSIEEDTKAIMIPITVIAPITAEIQNARLCAQLPSGTQTCNQIILNPQQTSYTPASVDMTTSPAPTVTASSQVTGTTDTGGGGAATSSSSSTTTTTITTTPGTTSNPPPTTTTTPPTSTNNNTTTNTTTGGATSSLPAQGGRDTTPPTLTVPDDMTLQTNGPTALLEYSVRAQDDRDGTATLDEDNQLIQGDNVGGNIFISCSPSSQYFLPVGNRTVECLAADAANNTADASFTVAVIGTTTTPSGGLNTGNTVTASANPAIYDGVPCPSTLEFSGTITDNVGNRDVYYRFIWSTGAATQPIFKIHFDQPGSQSVSYTSPGIVPPSLEGWVAIVILDPVQLQSNQAEMRIICAPSTGGAPSPSTIPAAGYCQGKDVTRPGTPGNDRIVGTDGPDVIAGLGGDDVIQGLGGDDIICGGEGNDRMEGLNGVDIMYGEDGNDGMSGDAGNDSIFGDAGNDAMGGQVGDDFMSGGEGDDSIYGLEGNDEIVGSAGNDVMGGNVGDDTMTGNAGNDVMDGQAGNDAMYGNAGDDSMLGGDGNDDISSGAGNDQVYGDAGNDVMNGGDGNDQSMSGGDGDDSLDGGEPATLPGDSGDGGAGIDQCVNLETPPINCEGASLVQQSLVGNATTLGNVTTLGNATGTPEGGVGGDDTTPPTVTVPNNMEVETDNPSGTSVTYNVRAVDNVDGEAALESDTIRQDNVGGSITIACDPPSGSTFPVGVTTTVQCNAYDAAGNVGTASFTITVTSTTPPQTLQAEEPTPEEEEETEPTITPEEEEETEPTTEEGGEEPSPPPPPSDDTGEEGGGEPPPDEELTTPPEGG